MNYALEPILLAGTVAVAAQTLFLIFFAVLHRGTEGIWYWVAGMVFFMVMMCLYLTRADDWQVADGNFWKLFGSLWLGNVFLVLAWLTYISGIRIFLGLKAPGVRQLSGAALIVLLLTYHTFVEPSAGWRSAWISIYAIAMSVLAIVNLLRHAEREIHLTSRLMAAVFAGVALLFSLQLFQTVRQNIWGDSDTFLNARAMFFGVPASSSLWVFSLLLMIYQRQRASMTALYKKDLEGERTRQRDRQRLRLARDLHDGLSGMITSMRWIAERQLTREADPEAMRAAIRKIHWLARESNEEVRMLLNKLENPNLSAMKWLAEWRQYAHAVVDLHGIEMEWEATGFTAESLGDSVAAVALWRVVKEALQNACAHSGARRIRLRHTIEGQRLTILVGDDGKGYEGGAQTGRGLRNIEQRMRDLGGTVEMHNSPGLQLTIQLELPLRLSGPVEPRPLAQSIH